MSLLMNLSVALTIGLYLGLVFSNIIFEVLELIKNDRR